MKRYILFSAIAGFALILAACGGAQGATPDASGALNIVQEDSEEGMNFSPDAIVLTAGQKVRLVIENSGAKNHEFMIGRTVMYAESGAPDGFEEDFFMAIADQVNAQPAMGAMVMMNGEVMSGMDMGMEEEMGDHMGWMLVSPTGSGQSVVEFTVPESAVGEWEMGCFEDDGTHYDDGMRGKVIVVAP